MQKGRAKKKWAVPSPFLLLIRSDCSRKQGTFEGDRAGPAAGRAAAPVARRCRRPRRDPAPRAVAAHPALPNRMDPANTGRRWSRQRMQSVNTAPRAAPANRRRGHPLVVRARAHRRGARATSPRCFRRRNCARAARFGTDALRQRWMAGRGALRTVLGRTLGIDPADVAIARGVRGRPELADEHGPHRLQRLAYTRRRAGGGRPRRRGQASASASTSSTATARSAPTGSRGSS